MTLRAVAYRRGLLARYRAPVPVVVVGNVGVGGNGKTPFTIWLTRWLTNAGLHPGIILRGYRGSSSHWPLVVTSASDPAVAGDEAVLLAACTRAPVVAGPDRGADCRKLLADFDCDVIVSDDGLQHLALARDYEIALHDASGGQGNGFCLPAGPLREPLVRLETVDLKVIYGDAERGIRPHLGAARSLNDPGDAIALAELADRRILALTAIARPERFFDSLAAAGLAFDRRSLPDHHLYRAEDIPGSVYDVILVTDKDAVKLEGFTDPRIRAVELVLDVAPAIIKHLERTLLPRLRC